MAGSQLMVKLNAPGPTEVEPFWPSDRVQSTMVATSLSPENTAPAQVFSTFSVPLGSQQSLTKSPSSSPFNSPLRLNAWTNTCTDCSHPTGKGTNTLSPAPSHMS